MCKRNKETTSTARQTRIVILVEEKLKERLGVKHWVNEVWKKEFIASYLILSLFTETKLCTFFVNKMELYQSKTLS